MALLQAVLVGLVALIVAPGSLFYFDVTPKWSCCWPAAALLLVRPRASPPKTSRCSARCSRVSLALSTAFSANPALSLFGTNWRRYGAVAQASLSAVRLAGRAAARAPCHCLRGISVAAAITALYGIAQYFGWDPFLPAAAYHIGEGVWTIVRPPGTWDTSATSPPGC